MNEPADVGHRHSLPASGVRAASAARSLSVRIVIPPAAAEAQAGQLLASCLVNLLSRQVGSVREIQLDCAPARTLVWLPSPTHHEDFSTALADLGAWTTGGSIPVNGTEGADPEVTIYVGLRPADAVPGAFVALASGWRAWFGLAEHAPIVGLASENPLGPFMAAALAAGEVFKRSRGILRGRLFDACGVSLWSMLQADQWDNLENGPPLKGCSISPAHLVGMGAVGQALLYAIRNAQLRDSYFVGIDNDKHTRTNLNRCFLAGGSDRKGRKVDVARRAEGGGLHVHAFFGDWNRFVLGPRPDLDAGVEEEVASFSFPLVLSCVDRGTSRHQIQALWPDMILAGRTTNLVAFADVFRNEAGAACLACHNPPERDGQRIQELRARLGDMVPEELRTHLIAAGVDADAVESELRRPTCGSIGEAQINKLATDRPPEFSVGFVSLASGLMLAANLLRATSFASIAPPPSGMTSFSFLHGRFDHTVLSVDTACELKCATERQV